MTVASAAYLSTIDETSREYLALPGGCASPALRTLDEHLLTVLRHIDRYQHGARGCRKELGHGRSASKVSCRELHFRDLRAGHGLP